MRMCRVILCMYSVTIFSDINRFHIHVCFLFFSVWTLGMWGELATQWFHVYGDIFRVTHKGDPLPLANYHSRH